MLLLLYDEEDVDEEEDVERPDGADGVFDDNDDDDTGDEVVEGCEVPFEKLGGCEAEGGPTEGCTPPIVGAFCLSPLCGVDSDPSTFPMAQSSMPSDGEASPATTLPEEAELPSWAWVVAEVTGMLALLVSRYLR